MTTTSETPAAPQGIHHVRLSVTDITRSKEFYTQVFGSDPAMDFSDQADDPGALQDPARLFAGCIFGYGDQLLGLRPVARSGDRFDCTRVGLDHMSFTLGSTDELETAAQRLDDAGIEHGEVTRLDDAGIAILSFQDPDDINLELVATL